MLYKLTTTEQVIVKKRTKEREVLISLPYTSANKIYLRLGDAGDADVLWQSQYAGGFLRLVVPANTAVYGWTSSGSYIIGVLDQR